MSEQKAATFAILLWLLLMSASTTSDVTHAFSVQSVLVFGTLMKLIMTYATWPE